MHSIFVTATSIERQCILIVEHAPTSTTLAAVTRDRAAAVLGTAAPVIAYAEREGDGVLVCPLTPDGDRLARLLAAQLTLCAAGLWPAPAPAPAPLAMMAALVRQVSDVPSTTPTPAWLQAAVTHAVEQGWSPATIVARWETVPAGPNALPGAAWHVYPDAATADAPRRFTPRAWDPLT